MELLEGRTWAELRQRAAENGKRMPAGVALRVLAEACRGLDAAHRAVDEEGKPLALVHRDFTPDNIHVGVKGEVKVIDFGIARTTAWGAGTEPGTLKGKFFYMSPEMITAKPVDHRADIFAAGRDALRAAVRPPPLHRQQHRRGRHPHRARRPGAALRLRPRGAQGARGHLPARDRQGADTTATRRSPSSSTRWRRSRATRCWPAEQEVADYVTALFPEKSDERRNTLRRAREADPSVPGQRAPCR